MSELEFEGYCRFRHTEDALLREENKQERSHPQGWRLEMYQHRLKVLRELNPIGAEYYYSYWIDRSTHYEKWYRKPKKVAESVERKLEDFLKVVS